MKPSKYNFSWSADANDKIILFNSLTCALAEVSDKHAHLLYGGGFDYAALPTDAKQFVNALARGGFILDDETDELKIIKYAYNSLKYNRNTLNLTIVPTLQCNFGCFYCYERPGGQARTAQNAAMPEAVRQAIYDFVVKRVKTVNGIHVTWFGGEPLLAKDIIFAMSAKLINIASAHDIPYHASMVTNGYLLHQDPDIFQKL
jgi:uncharacterized protein